MQQAMFWVKSPNGSHGPAKAFADSLKNPRRSFRQRWRLGEHTCDRVLCGQTRFFAFLICIIYSDRVYQTSFRMNNSRPQQPFEGTVLTKITVLEGDSAASGCDMRGLSNGGLSVFRVHKVQVGMRE